MSQLNVGKISGLAGSAVQVPAGLVDVNGKPISANSVLQMVVVRSDVQSLLVSATGAVAEITQTRATITPKLANSIILCEFYIHGEANTYNNSVRAMKNGVVSTGTYPGYNAQGPFGAWSGIGTFGTYESDYNTTPSSMYYSYFDTPGAILSVTYSLGVIDSTGGALTLAVNRTIGSLGASNQENGICITTLTEIAQ